MNRCAYPVKIIFLAAYVFFIAGLFGRDNYQIQAWHYNYKLSLCSLAWIIWHLSQYGSEIVNGSGDTGNENDNLYLKNVAIPFTALGLLAADAAGLYLIKPSFWSWTFFSILDSVLVLAFFTFNIKKQDGEVFILTSWAAAVQMIFTALFFLSPAGPESRDIIFYGNCDISAAAAILASYAALAIKLSGGMKSLRDLSVSFYYFSFTLVLLTAQSFMLINEGYFIAAAFLAGLCAGDSRAGSFKLFIILSSISILFIALNPHFYFSENASRDAVVIIAAWAAAVKIRCGAAKKAMLNEDDALITGSAFYAVILSVIISFNYINFHPVMILAVLVTILAIAAAMIENFFRANLFMTGIFIFLMAESPLIASGYFDPAALQATLLVVYIMISPPLLKFWVDAFSPAAIHVGQKYNLAEAVCVTAADIGNMEIIKEQVLFGLSPDHETGSKHLITIALEKDDEEFLVFLIKQGASLWKNSESEAAAILEWALDRKKQNALIILLDNGLDPNTVINKDGVTILMKAAGNNLRMAAEKILNMGADADTADIHQKTALGYALISGSAEAAPVIYKRSSIINRSRYSLI